MALVARVLGLEGLDSGYFRNPVREDRHTANSFAARHVRAYLMGDDGCGFLLSIREKAGLHYKGMHIRYTCPYACILIRNATMQAAKMLVQLAISLMTKSIDIMN